MNKKYILTGAMGSGKSTVLNALAKQGIKTIAEPARTILAEQRLIDGEGVPEKNAHLFSHLLLSRSVQLYKSNENETGVTIFDRGVIDNIAYAELFELDTKPFMNAAKEYTYEKTCFYLPPWQEIYTTDDERKMSYAASAAFGERLHALYTSFGYKLQIIPKVSIEKRVEVILNLMES